MRAKSGKLTLFQQSATFLCVAAVLSGCNPTPPAPSPVERAPKLQEQVRDVRKPFPPLPTAYTPISVAITSPDTVGLGAGQIMNVTVTCTKGTTQNPLIYLEYDRELIERLISAPPPLHKSTNAANPHSEIEIIEPVDQKGTWDNKKYLELRPSTTTGVATAKLKLKVSPAKSSFLKLIASASDEVPYAMGAIISK